MKAYRPRKPRAALGLSAVALAAVAFGASVVLPATLDPVDAESCRQAAAKGSSEAPIAVDIQPGRIDVIAYVLREPQLPDSRTTAETREGRDQRQRLRAPG